MIVFMVLFALPAIPLLADTKCRASLRQIRHGYKLSTIPLLDCQHWFGSRTGSCERGFYGRLNDEN